MMNMLTNFFITQLIWSITVGLCHVTINTIILLLLLKLWDHLKITYAFLLSILLNIGAFLLFVGIVGGFLWAFNIPYVMPQSPYQSYHDFMTTSVGLAGIYIVIQSIILTIIGQYKPLNMWRAFLCIVCSNLVTALLVYKCAVIKYK